jgi:hypothetical protein
MRNSLAVVVGFGFSLGILAWLYYPRFGHLLGPYFAGAATGVAAWIWDDPPEYIAKWKRGPLAKIGRSTDSPAKRRCPTL